VCVAAQSARYEEKLPQDHARFSRPPHRARLRLRLRAGHRNHPFRVAPKLEKIGPSILLLHIRTTHEHAFSVGASSVESSSLGFKIHPTLHLPRHFLSRC